MLCFYIVCLVKTLQFTHKRVLYNEITDLNIKSKMKNKSFTLPNDAAPLTSL